MSFQSSWNTVTFGPSLRRNDSHNSVCGWQVTVIVRILDVSVVRYSAFIVPMCSRSFDGPITPSDSKNLS